MQYTRFRALFRLRRQCRHRLGPRAPALHHIVLAVARRIVDAVHRLQHVIGHLAVRAVLAASRIAWAMSAAPMPRVFSEAVGQRDFLPLCRRRGAAYRRRRTCSGPARSASLRCRTLRCAAAWCRLRSKLVISVPISPLAKSSTPAMFVGVSTAIFCPLLLARDRSLRIRDPRRARYPGDRTEQGHHRRQVIRTHIEHRAAAAS